MPKKTTRTSKKGNRSDQTPAQVRIIGGRWRGRVLPVLDKDGLRPTGNRIRETLFNWLQFELAGRRCLDLCAGTGALGFESLSRGADHCDLVEPEPQAAKQLRANAERLQANAVVHHCSAEQFLANPTDAPPHDLVFLDPPFALSLWQPLIDKLASTNRLSDESLIYIEHPSDILLQLPSHWHIEKQKQAGKVRFSLVRRATK